MKKIIDILLVEDNSGDARLTAEALKESPLKNKLHVTKDGLEALAFLQKLGKYEQAPHPDLILLDLNLPKKNGFQFLEEIRLRQEFRHIPVMVLTTSNSEKDIATAHDLGANGYVTKPVDLEEFVKVIQQIENFWATTTKLPPSCSLP
ncbi:MAG: response regulator [Elusimicrobia bacterium]|nr:response regulator [Elusimicrobiota bacterium]